MERRMEDYLPPGFRFYPTEEELVSFYLYHKLEGGRVDLNRVVDQIIPVLDIYHFNPWDLPRKASLRAPRLFSWDKLPEPTIFACQEIKFAGEVCKRDQEQWFFFTPRQESEARGGRPKRVTTSGYWKATGSPSYVYSSNNHRSIGVKRSMVFYNGRAPKGTKTQWKMNEYKVIGNPSSSTAIPQMSLCRIYKKSKSLRAFDRRPPPSLIAAENPAEQELITQHKVDDQVVDGQRLPNPPLMEERPISPESFSSEATNNNNMQLKMEVDNNELAWDWHHLNWL